MISLLSLPTELQEQTAEYLSLRDLCNLRLAHPVVFPGTTIVALKKTVMKHWNGRHFSRRALPGGYSDYHTPRASSHGILLQLSAHPLFCTWITNIAIPHIRHTDNKIWPDFHPHAGRFLNRFPNLQHLEVGSKYMAEDGSGLEWMQDFVASPRTPALRYLTLRDLVCDGDLLAEVMKKCSATLREICFLNVTLFPDDWTRHILPALSTCTKLEFIKFGNPCITEETMEYEGCEMKLRVKFVHKETRVEDQTHEKIHVVPKGPRMTDFARITVIEGIENCNEALLWLAECVEANCGCE